MNNKNLNNKIDELKDKQPSYLGICLDWYSISATRSTTIIFSFQNSKINGRNNNNTLLK